MRETHEDKDYTEIAEQSWIDEFSSGEFDIFDNSSPPPISVLSRMVSIGMDPEEWRDYGVEIPKTEIDIIRFRIMIATQMRKYANDLKSELNEVITNYEKTMFSRTMLDKSHEKEKKDA